MADEFYAYDDEAAPKGRDNLFLWTVFILVLIGLAFACWLGSFYIFSHPEKPRAYKILKKLGKIDAPRRFEVTMAPPGNFLTAQQLFDKYSKFTRLEVERENGELLRNYIKNYRETKRQVPYVTGRFDILNSYELKPSDMFASGVVALMQSTEVPQVLIEHIFTAAPASVPAIRTTLQTGAPFKFERPSGRDVQRAADLSAVINLEKTSDGRLLFTVVPLLYANYELKHGSGTFACEPPTELNMDAGVPVIKTQMLQDAVKTYADYRRKRPIQTADASGAVPPTPAGPELVRVDKLPPGASIPESGTIAQVPVATPIPLPRPPTRPIATATPAATPPQLAMLTTPRPAPPVATPVPVAPALPRVSPQGVPLQPFIATERAPAMVTGGGDWRTFSPGKAPPARALTTSEASTLAGRGELGERIYLRGDFRVTASSPERGAILRSQGASGGLAVPGPETARIIVEYPPSVLPPPENSVFTRDANRPLEIRRVRRGADGEVNIYVREITQE